MLAALLTWIANVFVIGTTCVLAQLWFRYVCSLLIAAQTSMDCSESVARANALTCTDVLRRLKSGEALSIEQMDVLTKGLRKDFEVVCYLLSNLGQSRRTAPSGETWMLKLNYWGQVLRYHAIKKISARGARRRLNKMALIVCHFADLIGERSIPARA